MWERKNVHTQKLIKYSLHLRPQTGTKTYINRKLRIMHDKLSLNVHTLRLKEILHSLSPHKTNYRHESVTSVHILIRTAWLWA